MLGLAQLGARLGVQLEAQLGIGWEIGIRGSAGLTYLGLVLGDRLGARLGLEARSGSRFDQHPFASLTPFSKCQSVTHAVNLLYLVRTFFTSPIFFFQREASSSREFFYR